MIYDGEYMFLKRSNSICVFKWGNVGNEEVEGEGMEPGKAKVPFLKFTWTLWASISQREISQEGRQAGKGLGLCVYPKWHPIPILCNTFLPKIVDYTGNRVWDKAITRFDGIQWIFESTLPQGRLCLWCHGTLTLSSERNMGNGWKKNTQSFQLNFWLLYIQDVLYMYIKTEYNFGVMFCVVLWAALTTETTWGSLSS